MAKKALERIPIPATIGGEKGGPSRSIGIADKSIWVRNDAGTIQGGDGSIESLTCRPRATGTRLKMKDKGGVGDEGSAAGPPRADVVAGLMNR